MIPVFYDANAIFIYGGRDRVYPAGSLVASSSGSTVSIFTLHSDQPIVVDDYWQIADRNGDGFGTVEACVAYLNGEFVKRRSLGSSYQQTAPSDIWTIAHGLGFYPNVTIVDTAGDQLVLSDVSYVDINTARVSFGLPMMGTAYLS